MKRLLAALVSLAILSSALADPYPGGLNTPITKWSFPTQTAMNAATGLFAQDVNKTAQVTGDNTYWILLSVHADTTGTWQQFSPPGAGGGGGTITLSGDVTGSGTTSIATTYANAVPNAKAGLPTGGTTGQLLQKASNLSDYSANWVSPNYESALGNPAGNGYILSSTTAGARSWINAAVPTGGASGQVLGKNSATDYDLVWTTPAASGGGTVTSFSAGALSPLFTTSVATATTTPALSFLLTSAAANTVFGNASGSSAAPVFSSSPRFTAIGNLTTNGFVKTGGGLGTLSVDTSTYLTAAVTSIGTTSPITGGTITGTGTIAFNNGVDLAMTAAQTIKLSDAGTTTAPTIFTIGHNSSGTPAANFGTTMLWTAKSDTTNDRTIGDTAFLWSVPTDATRASSYRIRTVNSGSFVNSATFFASGGTSFNSTTDPGAGYVNANTGFKVAGALEAVDNLATTTTNDNAAAGGVGETVSSALASSAPVTFTTGQTKNVTSISLTAGDWLVDGSVHFSYASVTASTLYQCSANIGTTTGAIADDGYQGYAMFTATTVGSGIVTCPLPARRISLSATTTVYMVGKAAAFSAGNCAAFGFIQARRVR